MPIFITKDSVDYYLVPAPLFSFTRNTYNNIGRAGFGADYSVTLEGTLVPNKGNPFYDMTAGSTQPGDANMADSGVAWTKPSTAGSDASIEPDYGWDPDYLLASTLRKQEKIRWLFTNDVIDGVAEPIIVNITNWGETTDGIQFAAFVDDITFDSAGRGVLPGSYTINMRCDNFLNSADGNFGPNQDETMAEFSITSVTETFDIAEDERTIINFQGQGADVAFRDASKVYTVNKTATVIGAPVYESDGSYLNGDSGAPWRQASGYVYNVLGIGTSVLPDGRHDVWNQFGDNKFKAADRVITESIDKEAGSYSITESFVAYSGDPVIHTINVNMDVSENERRSVSIQGTIEGLNTEDTFSTQRNNYLNASGFNEALNANFNSGVWTEMEVPSSPYGYQVVPSAYFYAKSLSELSWLHPMPNSKSVGRDFAAGVITYNYTFDDRPPNLVSGSMVETITVNDTYPGELFSATPVIGRNQPVLQYLNSRSEYKRSLNINITMGEPKRNWEYTDATGGYWAAASRGNIQNWLMSNKPSISAASSGDLAVIYAAANPINDPNFNVRGGKCYHSAPTESWDPNSRSYSYNVEWTYEREV